MRLIKIGLNTNCKCLILGLVIFLGFLTGCSTTEQTTETLYTPTELAEVMLATQSDMPEMFPLTPNDENFEQYFDRYYQMTTEGLIDGIICYPNGALANEVTVLLFEDEQKAEFAEQQLESYIERRTNSFIGYIPEQAFLAEQGIIARNKSYVALMISSDNDAMNKAFADSFSNNPPPIPKQEERSLRLSSDILQTPKQDAPLFDETQPVSEDDIYDSDSIIMAFETGNMSNLTQKNYLILERCLTIIQEITTPDMSDYQKERAVHDYIIMNASYDEQANSQSPNATPDPDNENPYGLLYNEVAICYGYTSTFQLFMDLLGIDCVSVDGTVAVEGGEPHAWNKVKLEDEWYNVDLTWNDPYAAGDTAVFHNFFNVTDEYMGLTDHVWNSSLYPEATGEKFNRYYEE